MPVRWSINLIKGKNVSFSHPVVEAQYSRYRRPSLLFSRQHMSCQSATDFPRWKGLTAICSICLTYYRGVVLLLCFALVCLQLVDQWNHFPAWILRERDMLSVRRTMAGGGLSHVNPFCISSTMNLMYSSDGWSWQIGEERRLRNSSVYLCWDLALERERGVPKTTDISVCCDDRRTRYALPV